MARLIIAVLGATKSGKTKWVNRFISDTYNDQYYYPSNSKLSSFSNQKGEYYEVLDTAGEVNGLDEPHILLAHVILFVIDATVKFETQKKYLLKIHKQTEQLNKQFCILLTKIDLDNTEKITPAEINACIPVKNIFTISSRNNEGMTNIQNYFSKLILERNEFVKLKYSIAYTIKRNFDPGWMGSIFSSEGDKLAGQIENTKSREELLGLLNNFKTRLEENKPKDSTTPNSAIQTIEKCFMYCDLGTSMKTSDTPLLLSRFPHYGTIKTSTHNELAELKRELDSFNMRR